ncbi:DUF3265 domain-containing protein [Vibrio vulnificus]|nr:DUF3265 domain-containing protein [Vibrio vulnificus]
MSYLVLSILLISTKNKHITRRLSGIHAAWHFWYAVGFCGESGLRKLGLCGIHPLTRRYVPMRSIEL